MKLAQEVAIVTGAARGIGLAITRALAAEGAKVVLADLLPAVHESADELIDIIVNNAGITRDNLLLRMSEDDWEKVIAINLTGTFNLTKSAIKYMIKRRTGKIVNIASVIGEIGNAGQANYAASKAGVIAFTKSVAKELGSRGIRANAVAPGFIKSQMTGVLPDQVKKDLKKQIPLGRLGLPEDVARAVKFLVSPDAEYITGQVLNVDGGMVM